MDEKTTLYSIDEFNKSSIEKILMEVSNSLTEKGYNAVNQLAGYLMSGDPGYISSYQDARKKITSIERNRILEFLLKKSLGEKN